VDRSRLAGGFEAAGCTLETRQLFSIGSREVCRGTVNQRVLDLYVRHAGPRSEGSLGFSRPICGDLGT
jgi:hypothetical protein